MHDEIFRITSHSIIGGTVRSRRRIATTDSHSAQHKNGRKKKQLSVVSAVGWAPQHLNMRPSPSHLVVATAASCRVCCCRGWLPASAAMLSFPPSSRVAGVTTSNSLLLTSEAGVRRCGAWSIGSGSCCRASPTLHRRPRTALAGSHSAPKKGDKETWDPEADWAEEEPQPRSVLQPMCCTTTVCISWVNTTLAIHSGTNGLVGYAHNISPLISFRCTLPTVCLHSNATINNATTSL